MKTAFYVLFSLFLSFSAGAAVNSGEPAPDFTLVDTDGNEVSLSDYSGDYVVLEWLNHGCPFVVRHYDSGNIPSMQEELTGQGVVWLSIVSSAPGKQGHDSAKGHSETADKKGSAATVILIDESGDVGRLYAAKTTPHMYVIDPEGVLIYQGAIDDAPRGPAEGATNYVSAALTAAMNDEVVADSDTKPYGCSVKY